MSLPMSANRVALLLSLAEDNSAEARARLIEEAAALYTDHRGEPSQTERALFAEIMLALLADAEMDVRRRLSVAVKHSPWAPRTLIAKLALDEAPVAAPVISFSPVMDEDLLIEVVQEGTTTHRSLVAARPCISEPVAAAIVDKGERGPIRTLGTNATARIAPATMQAAIEFGRKAPDVLEAFGLRRDLPPDLIVMAYSYAGAAVRASLASRDDVDPARLDAAVAAAAVESARQRTDGALSAIAAARIARAAVGNRPSGPTPGILLQALMNGRLDLFENGMSTLTGLPPDTIHEALTHVSNRPLVLTARAAGFDVASVAGIHARLHAESDRPPWSKVDDAMVAEIYARLTPDQAAYQLAKVRH